MSIDQICISSDLILGSHDGILFSTDIAFISHSQIATSADPIDISDQQIPRSGDIIDLASQYIVVSSFYEISFSLDGIVLALELRVAVPNDGGIGAYNTIGTAIHLRAHAQHVIFTPINSEIGSCHGVLLPVDNVGAVRLGDGLGGGGAVDSRRGGGCGNGILPCA